MPRISNRFNCGEFLPGRRPVTGGTVNTVPPIYIPPPKKIPRPPFPPAPDDPRGPGSERRWACRFRGTITCPPPNLDVISSRVFRCIECNTTLAGSWPPECIYHRKELCQIHCLNIDYPCPIPQVQDGFKCVEEKILCPYGTAPIPGVSEIDPTTGLPIKEIIRRCEPCRIMPSDPDCIYQKIDDCQEVCLTSQYEDCVRTPRGPTTGGGIATAVIEDGWRCNTTDLFCQNGTRYGFIQECVQDCNLSISRPGDGCFQFKRDCDNTCPYVVQEDPELCDPVTPTGGTGVEQRFACAQKVVSCPEGQNGNIYLHGCIECVNNNGTWVLSDPTWSSQAGCVYTSRQNCADQCPSYESNECYGQSTGGTTPVGNPVTEENNTPVSEQTGLSNVFPGTEIPPGGGGGGGGRFNPEQLRMSGNNQRFISNSVIVTTDSLISNLISNIPTKQVEEIVLIDDTIVDNSVDEGPTTYREQGLYDRIYNFFTYPVNTKVELVQNDQYLNVFNTVITKEVKHFIDRQDNSPLPWSDVAISNLTQDKIAISLNTDLLKAFNNINDFGGQAVPLSNFLNIIQSLLLSGRISEFDSNYYLSLELRQAEDNPIRYSQNSDYDEVTRAALGLISNGASSSDYSSYMNQYEKNQIKRQRRLNTDINVKLQTVDLSGEYSTLPLTDHGVPTMSLDGDLTLSTTFDVLDLGDGAGYYISAIDFSGTESPVISQNDSSASFFIPPVLRDNVLRILNFDNAATLTVSSNLSGHELSTDYNPSADVSVMYFALDLDTLEDTTTNNSLVNLTTATFRLLSKDEAILHARNYSLNTSKLNINYDDPIIHYLRDTSSIEYKQYDVNFKNYQINRTDDQSILTRNIPFGLIITPGLGSSHNPYHAYSELINYNSSNIVRLLKMVPNIDVSRKDILTPPLDEKLIYDELGTYYYGLYEKYNDIDPQGIIYEYNPSSNLFSKSYYYSNSYSNIQPPSSTRTGSAESVIINLIDKLKTLYNPEELTWWDVYRRLNSNQIGKFILSNQSQFTNDLANGFKDIPIRDVLSSPNITETGILVDPVENDIIYIKEQDRENAPYY